MPNQTTSTDAVKCFVCGRSIGVFRWWCQEGQAHPSCIATEGPKLEAVRGK